MFNLKTVAIALLLTVASALSYGQSSQSETTTPRYVSLQNLKSRPSPVAQIYIQRRPKAVGDEFQPVIVSLWADGRVIWSHDLKNGGRPYKEAQLSQEEVSSLLRKIDVSGFLNSGKSTVSTLVVSGASKVVMVREGSDTLYLQAGHESGEGAPPPPFLADWNRIKDELLSAIPANGREVPEARFKLEKLNTKTGQKIEFADPKQETPAAK